MVGRSTVRTEGKWLLVPTFPYRLSVSSWVRVFTFQGLPLSHKVEFLTHAFYCSENSTKSGICFKLCEEMVKSLPSTPEIQVQSLGSEDPLEEGMATHSSILAWRIPWTEKPGRLLSMGS